MAEWVLKYKKEFEEELYEQVKEQILNKQTLNPAITDDVIKRFSHEGILIYKEGAWYLWKFIPPVPYNVPCKD